MEHAVAVGFIVNNGNILLGHRRFDRNYYPDCWDVIGGHINVDEEPEQTLTRELKEELGIKVNKFQIFILQSNDPDSVMYGFLVTGWEGTPENLAQNEHDQISWFNSEEIGYLKLALPSMLVDIRNAIALSNKPD